MKQTDMKKIVVINHTFVMEKSRKRWKLLAQSHPDMDVTLICPDKWIRRSFAFDEEFVGRRDEEGNFHVVPVRIETKDYVSWTSEEMVHLIRNMSPDLVYHVGSHLQPSLKQCLNLVGKKMPNTKMVTFSMRGPNNDILYKGKTSLIKRLGRIVLFTPKVYLVNKYSDAVICHYPDAMASFRKEGYKKPIYMCTQVGVDHDLFFPDENKRRLIRDKYQLGDSYVFGSAVRFDPRKGLDDIINALPIEGNWKCLIMGRGTEEQNEYVRQRVKERKLEDKIILTGYVERTDMPSYWNAVDCAIHTPRTGTWTETFSLTLVEAMITGLPVIGSTSGSVPYQLGPEGIIVEEQNVAALHDKIVWVLENRDEAKIIGNKMRMRAEQCFEIRHLNECLYHIFIDIMNEVYDKNKIDMSEYLVNNFQQKD